MAANAFIFEISKAEISIQATSGKIMCPTLGFEKVKILSVFSLVGEQLDNIQLLQTLKNKLSGTSF